MAASTSAMPVSAPRCGAASGPPTAASSATARCCSAVSEAATSAASASAGVACFLASDDAAYISGQTLYVDAASPSTRASASPGRASDAGTGSAGAEPQEQEAVLLARRGEPKRPRVRQERAVEEALGVAADQERRQRQAQLVQQAGGGELRVQGGAAFGEHRLEAARPEGVDRAGEVDVVLAGDDHVGDLGGPGARLRRRRRHRDHDRLSVLGGEE